MINVTDRVPTEVLANGAVRYEEFNASGVSQGYKYMKRADEPIVQGTAINKVLFDNINSDINSTGEAHICTLGTSTEHGTANLFVATSYISSYYNGLQVYIKVPTGYDATKDTYINLASLGEKQVVGDMKASYVYRIMYDGTQFNVITHKTCVEENITLSTTANNTIDLSDLEDYAKVCIFLNCGFKSRYRALELNGTGIDELNESGSTSTTQNITSYEYITNAVVRIEIDTYGKMIMTDAYGSYISGPTSGTGATFESREHHVYKYSTLTSFVFGKLQSSSTPVLPSDCKIVKCYKEV